MGHSQMPDFCPVVSCHHFYYFYFWDESWAYFSNKCFAISFDGAKISLVLSSPQKQELFHQRQMKFVQAALPHEENEKTQRRSCQCLFHIETILRKILRNEVENSGGNDDCYNIFVAVCTFSIESHLRCCCFCGCISGSNDLCNPGQV